MRTVKNATPHTKVIERHIGGRLAGRRRQLGLSARALDLALKVSPGGTARFEKGERSLSAAQLLALTDILGVPLDYFFEDSEEFSLLSPNVKDGGPTPEMVREMEHFLAKYMLIGNAKVRRDLLALLKAASRRGSSS